MRFSSIALFLLLSHSISGNEAKQTARSVLRRQRSLAIERKVPVLRRRRSLVIERKVSVQRRRRRQDRTESPSADLSKAPSDRTESPSDTPPKATSDRTEIVDDMKVKKVYRGCDDYYHNRDVESGDTRHCCNKLIWNGDAEDGNPGYWHSHGSGRVVMHTPGGSGSSYAVKAVDRQSPDDGLTHTIDIDCLTPGAVYKIEAEIRLLRGTRSVGCDSLTTDDFGSPARCPHLSLYTKTDGVEQSRFVAAIAARWRGRRWNKLTGYFTFMANELEGGMVYIVINKGRPDADIVVDNLSLETVDLIN
eukprot:CAMPEP_0172479604 /NCGR_PEP_ID=MMETSP1066-20121228/4330_1 /TAXON_ID=671091 /ORGANISM="Coscinodiscus wailesii, Strain CCMP2513" /LENGTH=304 /DNA_ID=CAMNT_0013240245 /DNA_START=155 /DNA_END=1069 /DNA_ORIENTATION=-